MPTGCLSNLFLIRTRDAQFFRTGFSNYRSLRASELDRQEQLPSQILEFDLRQRLAEDPFYGSLWASADAAVVRRESGEDMLGRDVGRLGFGLDWQTSHIIPGGLVAEAEANLGYDFYQVEQDTTFGDAISRFRQGAALALRFPLQRNGASGVRHLLEPMVQIGWADLSGDEVPNEDSTDVEFDEGNLLSLSRFPGNDLYEEGLRLNFGLGWTRFDPDGWSVGATAGRIYRFDGLDQFGTDTGLDGSTSDWLIALHYRLAGQIALTTRSLVSDQLDLSSSETRFSWQNTRAQISGAHLWRAAELTDDLVDDLSELTLDTSFSLTRFIRANTEWRYDAEEGETTRAGVGLTFENECLQVDLSLSRRFTSSSNVDPSTQFNLRVALAGLGTGGERRPPRRQCRG